MISFIQHIGRIQFGFDAITMLGAELDLLNVQKPLLMTDSGVIAAGLDERVLDSFACRNGSVVVFADCPRHPTENAARAALAMYCGEGCDGIVALGGGAVIDLAKTVALLATHPGSLEQYAVEVAGGANITAKVAPLLCIPTTAGTGSEVGRGAGIALGEGGEKAVFMSVNLVPKVAICDPGLTMSLPTAITAGTGADALGHALEGYLSPVVNPPVDAIALDAVSRLSTWLVKAVEDPADRDARWHVMMGALQGGMCMWKGLGVAHALSIPLDIFGLHHGTLIGLLLPEAAAFGRLVIPEKLERLDIALGGVTEERLRNINRRVGLPLNLASMDVSRAVLPSVARGAVNSVFNRSAPRPANFDEYQSILNRIY